jgi:rubredoxin
VQFFLSIRKLSHDHDHHVEAKKTAQKPKKVSNVEYVHQCKACFTVYEEKAGEPANGIAPGTAFNDLPNDYCCPLCENPKDDFVKVQNSSLGLQPI